MNQIILVIHYHSGIITYIPKDERALDIIISSFDYIEEVIEVDIDPHAKKRADKITSS